MVYIGLRCRLEDRGGERLATLHAASRFIEQLSMFATVNRSCNLVDSFCPFGKVYLLSLTYSVVVADVVELSDYFRPYYLEFYVFCARIIHIAANIKISKTAIGLMRIDSSGVVKRLAINRDCKLNL